MDKFTFYAGELATARAAASAGTIMVWNITCILWHLCYSK
jgi:hypothetical protein